MTVQASLLILHSTDGRLVRFQGDEDMRSESRKGRSLTRGKRDESLPDGRLYFSVKGQAERRADIEILTSKYTDAVILKKFEELEEGTIFAAPTEKLADRMAALTDYTPLLLTP